MEVETDAEYFDYLAVYPIRICIAFFVGLEYALRKPTPGMIQEGGISPLLGRFKGIPKGEIEIPLWRFLFTASGFFFAAQRKRG